VQQRDPFRSRRATTSRALKLDDRHRTTDRNPAMCLGLNYEDGFDFNNQSSGYVRCVR
jgi:hypothetical protein